MLLHATYTIFKLWLLMVIIIIIIIFPLNIVITSHLFVYLFIYRCGELYLLNNPRACNRDAAFSEIPNLS